MAKKTNKKKIPKAKTGAYLLQIDPKKLFYEDLPNAKGGMYMDPGPRMPNLAKSLEELYPPGEFTPNINAGVRQVQGPVPIGTPPDTSKLPQPPAPTPASIKPPKAAGEKRYNAGNMALAALTAFDAVLPSRTSRQTVVQPQMAYNPMPYGYGSQALMENGGPMPKTNLNSKQEKEFNIWKSKLPKNLQYEGDYNLKQLWLENPGIKPSANMHFPDKYKLPNHPTFSNESMYFNPTNQYMAGSWQETDSSFNYMPYNAQYKQPIVEMKKNGGYVMGKAENNLPSAKNGKQMKKKKTKKYDDGGGVPALFGLMDTFFGEIGSAAQGITDIFTGGGGGGLTSLLGMENGGEVEQAKDGKWIQKAINPKHKGYCTPMTKSTCTPKRKALAKTLKKMAKNRKKDEGGFIQPGWDKYDHGGIIPDPMSNFSPHKYEHGGDVNGCAKIKEVGPKYPNSDLMEQWLLYEQGGNVNGGAKTREVGANYPNTDLLEQWLLYKQGGNVNGGAKVRDVNAAFPNTDLMEQWLLYRNGGKAVAGDSVMSGNPGKPSPQEAYYQSSARLSYYKDLLNQKLKAKNPQAYTDYFKGLVDLRRAGNTAGASQYIQSTPYNEYLTPDEVQSTLGERYNDYLESIKNVNAYNVAQGQQPLYGTVEGEDDITKLNYGRRFASLAITPSASVYNKERKTNYRRDYTYDPNANTVNFTETGDLRLRPDYLSDPTSRPTPTITFKNGGVMYDDGGMVETMWGGSADLESYNPYDGGTIEFNGPSHDRGGIGMAYNGNPIEVEGGEYASKDATGNLNIFGNMFIPGTKTKFKKAAGAIASKEKRYDFLKTRGSELVNNSNPANKFEQLAFNAGKVMMQGGEMGQADLAEKKEKLAALQKDMLQMAEFYGIDPFEMSKGKMKKAKKGASIPSMENGGEGEGDGNDPTRSDRNMNPGNIKYGEFAKKYGAKKDKDGFAIFPSREVGFKAMRDLLNSPSYRDMTVSAAIKKWTGGQPYRYNLPNIKDRKVSDLNAGELDELMGTMTRGEGTRYGMTPRPVPPPRNTPTPRVPDPSPYTPYTIPDIPLDRPVPGTTPVNPVPPYDQLEVPERRPIPSNVEPLHLDQVLGELYGIATNKVEPVPAQRYEPQLYVPYQVSFQDRINANQSAFNAQMRAVGAGNPAALGTLAAQKYAADQAVYGDEFRTNQAIANDITNKNIALVNDANLKNLGIADTQMVRQSQARSKTRELNQMILNSISSKYAQNEFENKRLATYENLYDYRFVPQEDGGLSATYFGPNAMFNYSGRSAQPSNFANPSRTITRYDAHGNVRGYTEYDDSELRDQQKLIDLEIKRRKLPLMEMPPLDSK